MEKVKCRWCGAENSPTVLYCSQCGAGLQDDAWDALSSLQASIDKHPDLTDPNLPEILWSLGRVRTEDLTGVLVAFLRDHGGERDDLYRERAAAALGEIGTAEAYEALASMSADDNWAVRRGVMRGIGRTGQAKGLGHLLKGLGDSNAAVVITAAEALTWIDYVGAFASADIALDQVKALLSYMLDPSTLKVAPADKGTVFGIVLPRVAGATCRILQGNPESQDELLKCLATAIRSQNIEVSVREKLIAAAYTNFPRLLPILSDAGVISGETDQYGYFAEAILNLIRLRDPRTYEHSLRVARYAKAIGKQLGLSDSQLVHVYRGGLLHDVGKIGVPDHVLRLPARLTKQEFELYVWPHPEHGAEILRPFRSELEQLMALQHHERFDGTGYPSKLRRQQISLWGRIAAVADAVSAMLASREYRAAKTTEWVISQLLQGAGRQFDPEIVDAFITAIAKGRLTLP